MSSKTKSNPYSSLKKSSFNQLNKKKKNNELLGGQKNVEKNKFVLLDSYNFNKLNNKLNPKTSAIILQERNFNIKINPLEKLTSINNALIEDNFNKNVIIKKQENIKHSKENNEHKGLSPNQEKIKPYTNKKRLPLNKKTNIDNKFMGKFSIIVKNNKRVCK